MKMDGMFPTRTMTTDEGREAAVTGVVIFAFYLFRGFCRVRLFYTSVPGMACEVQTQRFRSYWWDTDPPFRDED